MNRLLPTTSVFALFLSGCAPLSVSDYLTVAFPAPAEIDIVCKDGGCETLDTLSLTMTWETDPVFLEGSTLTLYEYRIDYSIPGIDGEIPYFAGISEQTLELGESLSFSIMPIGNQQRELLTSQIPADEVYSGMGILTFAGWDMNNEVIVFPEDGAVFSIGAGNFSALSGTPSTTTGI